MDSKNTKFVFYSVALIVIVCFAFLAILWIPSLAPHLLLVTAIALLLAGMRSQSKCNSQTEWVEKEAVLKRIEECEEVVMTGVSRLKYYYPVIEYEYFANGATHLSAEVSLEIESIWVSEVNIWGDITPENERWWLSLKTGDKHPVYVNPHNETQAVLIREDTTSRSSHHLALLVAGVLVGLIWFAIMFSNMS